MKILLWILRAYVAFIWIMGITTELTERNVKDLLIATGILIVAEVINRIMKKGK